MIKKLPCLYNYIANTEKGNRNSNLFKAINHLCFYNKKATITNVMKEALRINKALPTPLREEEVKTIVKHAKSKNYHTSCYKFKRYCEHCRHGKFRKTFNNSKPKYWKHLNENNRLYGIKVIADDTYYPWDILDTDELTQEQKKTIYKFREDMNIPIDIDKIIKAYGLPIGDKAKQEWEKFKKKYKR